MTSDASDAARERRAPREDAPVAPPRETDARADAGARRGRTISTTRRATRCERQIEFYLGDSNLPRDAFLLDEVSRATREGHDGGGADRAHRVVLEDAGFFGDVRGEG